MRALYGDGEKMIDFTKDGKRFIAGRGFLSVFNQVTGDEELGVMDVFRETDPTPETVIELYNVTLEIMKDLEKKPKQTKVKTKDPF